MAHLGNFILARQLPALDSFVQREDKAHVVGVRLEFSKRRQDGERGEKAELVRHNRYGRFGAYACLLRSNGVAMGGGIAPGTTA